MTRIAKIAIPLLIFLQSAFSALSADEHPFNYDLHPIHLPSKTKEGKVLLCLHGYGGNHSIGNRLRTYSVIDDDIVSFNFPDHDIQDSGDPHQTCFGSIQELLPPLYLIKTYIIDKKHESINLYGFSAGGGALINLLSVLNTKKYASQLKTIGITEQNKSTILKAIQKGHIILDCPLKSMEGLSGFSTKQIEIVGKRYKENDLRPIDSIEKLKGLSLNILLHFQQPDEILSNRDDALYIQALQRVNVKGNTHVVISNDGGHNAHHVSMWEAYPEFAAGKQKNLFIDKTAKHLNIGK